MTNIEKINYLNHVISKKGNHKYDGPNYLYKYRSFDIYTFDMLENEYVYLCPAEKEDDETECLTTFDFERLFDLDTNNLKRECVAQIIELIKPYTNMETYEIIKNMILSKARKDGTIPGNLMMEIFFELQDYFPESVDVSQFINWIVSIPEKLDEPGIKRQLKPLFLNAYNARKETGICSFAESKDIDYMWKNYAGESSGYCIEYELSNYEYNIGVFPVIYQDERETNIIKQIVSSFIGQMIKGFSNGQIKADSSQYLRLFLTKYTKWSYQNEWRLIGEPDKRMKAPNIKCIYLGKNVCDSNKKAMMEFAATHNIEVVQLEK